MTLARQDNDAASDRNESRGRRLGKWVESWAGVGLGLGFGPVLRRCGFVGEKKKKHEKVLYLA